MINTNVVKKAMKGNEEAFEQLVTLESDERIQLPPLKIQIK
ncbi:hypothetical protein [Fictibacillus barbaricus]|nr:hypothetical protein [Fictibacillus barbaricus]GGB67935.1 hypothetical protein GCM10007199_37610 [Fictibacillus barbaricus]